MQFKQVCLPLLSGCKHVSAFLEKDSKLAMLYHLPTKSSNKILALEISPGDALKLNLAPVSIRNLLFLKKK